jgi:hypothetical protein
MTNRIPAMPAVAAYAAQVDIATVRKWAARGHISGADLNGCYDLVEILAWVERRDTRKVRTRAS